MRKTSVAIVIALGACVVLPQSTAFAQCSCTSVCPATPYAGPTACASPAGCPGSPVVDPCNVGPVTFVNQTTLSWSPSSCGTSYDVAMGDLACIKGGCSVCLTCAGCFVDNLPSTMVTDSSGLALGQGVWYLVRVEGLDWDSNGTSQCSSYDTPLTGICPF